MKHRSSWKGEIFKCVKCPETFIHSFLLNTHMRQVHRRDEQKKVCSFCGKTLADAQNLKKHEKYSCLSNPNTANLQLSKCHVCHRDVKMLQEHIRRFHQDELGIPIEKKHGCEKCGKLFSSAAKLKEHMPTHYDKDFKDPRFQCPICHKFLKQANSFKKHMVNSHDQGHACDVDGCDKKFYSAEYLKTHKRDVHKLIQ